MQGDNKGVAVPLAEQLRSVPLDAVLRIDTPNALGCMDTHSIPVGRLCHEAADALGGASIDTSMLFSNRMKVCKALGIPVSGIDQIVAEVTRLRSALAAPALEQKERLEPSWWSGALNRRVTIEQRMLDAAGGKRPMPSPEELRAWAIKLGTPESGEPSPSAGQVADGGEASGSAEQFAPNHKLCYRCQGSGRERGRFLGVDPGDCMDCGGKGVVFKGTSPPTSGVSASVVADGGKGDGRG